MFCERGKMNLGEGFNSAGPFVAGWLSELGVENIESYVSDKTSRLLPPYASAYERALIHEIRAMHERQFWIWDRKDTHRYFLAGGGAPDAFDACWLSALASDQTLLEEIAQGTFRDTLASVCLLVSGRKPLPH